MFRVLSLVILVLSVLQQFYPLRAASCLTRTNSPTLSLPATLNTSGYISEPVFPGLEFEWPVSIAAPAGETNRLFIAEKAGIISVITNLAAPTRSVFLDMSDIVSKDTKEDGLLGMALHPGFATNGYVFVFYTTPTNGTKWDCIARFKVDPQNPNRACRESHTVILYQIDPTINHNAGDVHFGPDGYLYASMGDPNGTYQQIYNLHSGMLRIDVDRKPGNIPPNPVTGTTGEYFVPSDNPYIGATTLNGGAIQTNKVRTEFYAIGLRNPWRFSFDSLTGDLYVGDVGLWTWEEVNIVKKGKNYGWGYAEGTMVTSPGYASYITPPLYQYGHDQGLAIIGGTVYRGAKIPDLYGCYVFSDYASGTIWSLRYTNGVATNVRELCNYPAVICFGTDPRNGDVLLASADKSIRRITKTGAPASVQIPTLLSLTGAFDDLNTLTAIPGIEPYEINVPFWSDNAQKRRWFMVPTGKQIEFQRDDTWHFPLGTTWIKHFDLETTPGDPSSRRKIETRFLVLSEDGAYGLSYAWNDEQTDANLVDVSGMTANVTITNNGEVTTQQWQYPGRSQCLTCHTRHSEFALGFTTRQLNRDIQCPSGGTVNQIEAMSDAGYFTAPVTNRYVLPSLASMTNTNQSLEFRARSYLAANCSQCHQRFGWGFSTWDARISTPYDQAGLVTQEYDDYGYLQQMIVPGDPNSPILQRMQGISGQRMPPLASSVIDQAGIDLLTEWVQNLPDRESFQSWQAAYNLYGDKTTDTDNDGVSDYQEYLAGTDPKNPASPWKSTLTSSNHEVQLNFNALENRIYEVQRSTNLLYGWQPLNHPNNSPNPTVNSGPATLNLGAPTNGHYFYRVQIREP